MSTPTLQSIIEDVIQRVNWETELAHPGYAHPMSGTLPDVAAASVPLRKGLAAHSANSVSEPSKSPEPYFHGGARAKNPFEKGRTEISTPISSSPEQGSGQAALLQPQASPATGETIEQPRAHALSALKFRLEKCTACGLSQSRSRIVFSDGTQSAPIAFVGDAPSRQEDLVSLPFVGERGHLLNKIILAIGQRRENSYLCNVIKCAPAAGQSPSPSEVKICSPFLFEQLKLVSPKVIVALGQIAASAILGTSDAVPAIRGQFHTWQTIPVMPTWSLDDMLATPALKREVWNDMKQVKAMLENA
ncbi:MAG: uracil-DNA glycosylase [Deltaproteobacteria bacterium]|nr:uracil-DNA glycosylase [Deltaproteobacteria bacterium]